MRTQRHAVQADGSATTMVIARAARDLRDGDSLLRFEPAPDQDSDRGNAIRLWLGRPPPHTHTHTHTQTRTRKTHKIPPAARTHTRAHTHAHIGNILFQAFT